MATAILRKFFYVPSCVLSRQSINASTAAAAHPPLILPGNHLGSIPTKEALNLRMALVVKRGWYAEDGPLDDDNLLSLGRLVMLGRLSDAQYLTGLIIHRSDLLSDVESALSCADTYGLLLSQRVYEELFRKLQFLEEYDYAEYCYFQRFLPPKMQPTSVILSSMVVSLSKSGRIELARIFFLMIFKFRYVPGRDAYNEIVLEHCRQSKHLAGFIYFRSMPDRGRESLLSLHCYNQLMLGLCHQKHIKEAYFVYQIMRFQGVAPTHQQHRSIFYGLGGIGMVREAESVAMHMEESGYFTTRSMFLCMVENYRKLGMLQNSIAIFLKMFKKGCAPIDCIPPQ